MSNSSELKIYAILTTIIVAPFIAVDAVKNYATQRNIGIVKVSNAERIVSGSTSKYLVWIQTQNGEEKVVENSDIFWFGKFNSSDYQGEFMESKENPNLCFNMTLTDVPAPLFSWYEKISRSEKVQCPTNFNGNFKPIPAL